MIRISKLDGVGSRRDLAGFKAGAELVISLRGHMGLLAASEETFG